MLHTQQATITRSARFPNNEAAAIAVNANFGVDTSAGNFEIFGGVSCPLCQTSFIEKQNSNDGD
jgi:hypothetical protein